MLLNFKYAIWIAALFFISCSKETNPFGINGTWGEKEVFITVPTDDERLFVLAQMHYIPTPKILLMGSSRLMLADFAMFNKEHSLFNSSISVAVIQDMAAIWQSLKKQKKIPDYFVISLDPWIFNRNNGRTEWKSIQKQYHDFLDSYPEPCWKRYYRRLFSKFRLWTTGSHQMNSMNIVNESEVKPEQSGKRGDGSHVYPTDYINESDSKKIRKKVDEYLQGCVFSMCNWEFNEEVYQALVSFLRDVQAYGGNILLILPPYHPNVYKKLYVNEGQYRKALLEVENVYQSRLQSEKDLQINFCNVLDPAKTNCDQDEFIDGMHYRKSCTEKIIKACVGKYMPNLLQ